MIRRAYFWAAAGLVPAAITGCAPRAEDDPFLVIFTIVAYAAAIGLFSFLVYRAIWGEEGPR